MRAWRWLTGLTLGAVVVAIVWPPWLERLRLPSQRHYAVDPDAPLRIRTTPDGARVVDAGWRPLWIHIVWPAAGDRRGIVEIRAEWLRARSGDVTP